MRNIYIIRHCQASGQAASAELTDTGTAQAQELAELLKEAEIKQIISSPYARAVQSIKPLAETLKLEIEMDERLKERVLSTANLPNWFEQLKSTFNDHELKLEGGESSKKASERISQVVTELEGSLSGNAAIVTHGNIMALLLSRYIDDFGFEEWRTLSNPDVYVLRTESGETTCERIWK